MDKIKLIIHGKEIEITTNDVICGRGHVNPKTHLNPIQGRVVCGEFYCNADLFTHKSTELSEAVVKAATLPETL